MIDLYGFVIFVERVDTFVQTASSCKLLSEQISQKVHVPQAQDPMVLIGELVKALNLYSNPRVAHHSNMNNNSNISYKTRLQSCIFFYLALLYSCIFIIFLSLHLIFFLCMWYFLEHKILWYTLRCSWLASKQWWDGYLCLSH